VNAVALPWPSLGHRFEAAATTGGNRFRSPIGLRAADREVNRRADLLRRLGVRQGEAVALMLHPAHRRDERFLEGLSADPLL
jgi:hypothetical protein